MNKILRIGSVGTSSIMDVMQEAIRLTEGMECGVVYSRDEGRGRAYADKVGVPEVCTDYEALIRREDLDVIYLASPNACHVEQAAAALKAGKHVIVEKPAALDRAGVDLLHQLALEHGVFFFEAITTLFMPNYIACKELLPSLGQIKSARIRYGQYSSKFDDYLKGKVASSLDPALQGGALNDMGIYCVHMAADLFGAPEAVSYDYVTGPNGADLEGVLTLVYPHLTCVLETAKNRDIGSGCRIEGEHGFFLEEGPINDYKNARAQVDDREISIDLQGGENRILYELRRFRDAIVRRDEAFFQRMYCQSRIASGILEDAHA